MHFHLDNVCSHILFYKWTDNIRRYISFSPYHLTNPLHGNTPKSKHEDIRHKLSLQVLSNDVYDRIRCVALMLEDNPTSHMKFFIHNTCWVLKISRSIFVELQQFFYTEIIFDVWQKCPQKFCPPDIEFYQKALFYIISPKSNIL